MVAGISPPNRLNASRIPIARTTPNTTPRTEPITLTTSDSTSTMAAHLSLGGPDRPQQRELLRPLCDDHLEGVEDQETADEQRHVAERHQEGVHESERFLEPGELLFGGGLGIDNRDVVADDRFDRRDQLVRRDTLCSHYGYRVDLSCRFEQALSGLVGEGDKGRSAEVRRSAETDGPHHSETLRGAESQHAHLVTDLEFESAGGGSVDRQLPVTSRGRTLPDRHRAGDIGPAGTDRRWSEAPEGFAVRVDERDEPGNAPHRDVDSVE